MIDEPDDEQLAPIKGFDFKIKWWVGIRNLVWWTSSHSEQGMFKFHRFYILCLMVAITTQTKDKLLRTDQHFSIAWKWKGLGDRRCMFTHNHGSWCKDHRLHIPFFMVTLSTRDRHGQFGNKSW